MYYTAYLLRLDPKFWHASQLNIFSNSDTFRKLDGKIKKRSIQRIIFHFKF